MGKTPYWDDEDPFNARGIGDNKSDGIASQSQGDDKDNVVEPDGPHDMRAARAQQQQSADNAAQAKYARHQPTWGQPLVTPTTTTTPATGKTAYLGLTDRLDWGVARLTDKNKISSKLKCQPTSGKDKETSKKILENVLQVRGFNAFLFMTKDSSIVKMAHSVAKFATINPITDNVDGKIFAFIGDRLCDQEPRAILIPTNTWIMWTTHKVSKDVKKMLEHYKEKKNYRELYQEAGATSTKHVPNILAILLSAVRLFNLHKKGKMPHKCLNLLMSHINDPNITDDKDDRSSYETGSSQPHTAMARRRRNQASSGLTSKASRVTTTKYESGSANVWTKR